jgi:FKBP-type peptidyl-prolyl cis-trans isomerase
MKKLRLILLQIALCFTLVFGLSSCALSDPSRNADNQEATDEEVTAEEETPAADADPETELEITDEKAGKGAVAKNGDKVSVHYVGKYKDGSTFDSSVERGEPFEFTIGKGEVIQGWDQGVPGMKVGGKRKLVVPSNLGYQDGKTMIFDVELIDIVK